MTIMSVIYILLVGVCLSSLARNGVISLLLRRARQHVVSPQDLTVDKHLCMILRVYQEEAMIEAAIHYVAQCVEGMRNVSVIVVGTARERDQHGRNPTLELAKAAAVHLPRFEVIEAENKVGGTHAHQTNWALRAIKTPPSATWIFTLDIDSRFSTAGLYATIDAINAGMPIIQQHALFILNFPSLPFSQRAHALYQSCWTIRHEMKRIYLSNKTKLSVAHVTGHGLCINLEKLHEYGDFPEETPFEDINLGFYLVASKEIIHSLPVFELGDTPPSLGAGLRQEYSWSYAAMMYPWYLANYRRRLPERFSRNRIRSITMTAMGVWSYLRWLAGSWFSIALVIAAVSGNTLAIACCLAVALEYFQCVAFISRYDKLSPADSVMSPLYLIVGIARRSAPADLAFVHWITRGSVLKLKTPHSS